MPEERLPKDEYVTLCRDNVSEMERELQNLGDEHWDDNGLIQWRDFRDHAGRISQRFKDRDFKLFKTDRERLWSQFSEIQSQAYDARKAWENNSAQRRDLILSKLNDTYWAIEAAESAEALEEIYTLLKDVREWMKNGWDQASFTTQLLHEWVIGDPGILTGADRYTLNQRYNELREKVNETRYNASNINRSLLATRIGEAESKAEDEPREAAGELRDIREEMKNAILTKEDRDALFHELNSAWAAVKAGFSSKDQEWRARLEGVLANRLETRDRVLANIEDLTEKINSAWNDDYRERAEGWREEAQERLGAVERQIEDIEQKLARRS